MLRLNVSDVDLDLYQDEAVNLTIQFSDLESINSPVGSFSQTFRVPGTAKNMDVFGPINTSDPGSVNLKLKKVAELFSGSVSILRGFVQVKAVYLQKQHYADIELVFFAGAVDLKTAIGDAKLSDLNTTAKKPRPHLRERHRLLVGAWHWAGGHLRASRQGFQLEFPIQPTVVSR